MKLRDILDKEFEEIVTEFQNRGIIFEGQFKIMTSMFCKKYSMGFCELLKEETGLNVWYGYQVPYFPITIVKGTIIKRLLLLQKSTKLKKGICNNFRRGVIKQ